MADAYTGTAALSVDQAAYELMVRRPLRSELYFDDIADVQTTRLDKRGASVTFTFLNDMAIAVTPLSETVDPDAIALSDSQQTYTLVEYGNTAVTTAKLRLSSFVELDPEVAERIGYNAGRSVDALAGTALLAGSNVFYGGAATSRVTVAAASTLSAAVVRKQYTGLLAASVRRKNGFYTAIVHPDQTYDLKSETGSGGWRAPHEYVDPSNIYNGELGYFEGFRFIVTPNVTVLANAGVTSTVEVYQSLFTGAEGLVKGHSTGEGMGALPRVRMAPIVDSLWRMHKIGWYWFGVYGIFRAAAVRRVETSSSLATNV